uniref:hypothetical protein n=1 Tax=Pseudomonas sp. NBRC 111140 TaxID=1661055 RepID=UPI000AD17964
AVLMTVERPLEASYYKGFVAWIDGPGANIVANLLRTWQFPADWDAHAPAPQTIAAVAVQRGAQGPLYAVLEEMCEGRTPPFDKNAFTARQVADYIDKLYGLSLKCNTTSGACGKQLAKLSQLELWGGKVLRKSLGHTKSVSTQVYAHVAAIEWWEAMSPEARGDYLDTGRCLSPVQTHSDDSEVADHE